MHVGSDTPGKIVKANVTKESAKNVTRSLANMEVVANEDLEDLESPKVDIKQDDLKAEICALKKTLSDLLGAKTEVEALKKLVETLQNKILVLEKILLILVKVHPRKMSKLTILPRKMQEEPKILSKIHCVR